MPLAVERDGGGAAEVKGQRAIEFAVEAALRSTRMFGYGAVVAGTAVPTAGGSVEVEWRIEIARVSVNSDVNGDAAITFPTAFPRGLYGIVVCCDTASTAAARVKAGTEALSGFTVNIQASVTAKVTYVAVGY